MKRCTKMIDELKLKIDELYGELVRARYGEHTRIGVVIADVEKIEKRMWEIKSLADEIDCSDRPTQGKKGKK